MEDGLYRSSIRSRRGVLLLPSREGETQEEFEPSQVRLREPQVSSKAGAADCLRLLSIRHMKDNVIWTRHIVVGTQK